MNPLNDYLKRALDADAAADWASDPEIVRQYRDIADQWRALAHRVRDLPDEHSA